jgi:hypothetical protein
MPSSKEARRLTQQHRRQLARLSAEEVQNPTVSFWDSAGDLGFQPALDRSEVLAILNASTRKAAQDIFDREAKGTSPVESKLMLRFGRALREACLVEAEVLLHRCM